MPEEMSTEPDQPYIDSDDVVTANEAYTRITTDQVEVARLSPPADEDGPLSKEWALVSAGGVQFPTVHFEADDEEDAIAKAKGWMEKFFREEPDQIP
jgi:hypothetical protein